MLQNPHNMPLKPLNTQPKKIVEMDLKSYSAFPPKTTEL